MRSGFHPILLSSALLTAVALRAGNTPMTRMPDRSKAERVGYVVETEGGEGGPQSVFVPAKKGSSSPSQAMPGGMIPMPGAVRKDFDSVSGATSASNRKVTEGLRDSSGKELPFFMTRTETDEPNAGLNRMTRKEENLSELRYDKTTAELKDSRFDRKDAISYEMWGRRFDSFGRKRNDSVDMDSRFDAQKLAKETVSYDRLERRVSSRDGQRAEVSNWDSRRERETAPGYGFNETKSPLQSRLSEGFNLLTRVSMQDINRYQFRRNRSSEKGDLPVGKPGREAEPMPAGMR